MKILLCVVAFWTLAWTPRRQESGEGPTWVEAVAYELPEGLTRPDPRHGAMGACGVAFRIGPHPAGAIVDRLERKGLGVFISITV